MLQAAAVFGGGVFLKQKLDEVALPQLRRTRDGVRTFTLSVRVLAASVPGLDAPGLLSQSRPCLEGSLGASTKETEFADFASKDQKAGPYAQECPWRFGDTLTFKVRPEDLNSSGLRMTLRVRRDVVLGPLQFEMRACEVGVGCFDLKQRVLPACVQERREPCGSSGSGGWESPVVLVPLSRTENTSGLAEGLGLGEAVAHVAVVFSVDTDPDFLLDPPQYTFAQRVEEQVDGVVSWLNKKVDEAMNEMNEGTAGTAGTESKPHRKWDGCEAAAAEVVASDWLANCKELPVGEAEGELATERADGSAKGKSNCIEGPDLAPEGWVCHCGPNGRTFWHHKALGPAPWEVVPPNELPQEEDKENMQVAYGTNGKCEQMWRSGTCGPPESEACQPPPALGRRSNGLADAGVSSYSRLPRGQPASEVFDPACQDALKGSSEAQLVLPSQKVAERFACPVDLLDPHRMLAAGPSPHIPQRMVSGPFASPAHSGIGVFPPMQHQPFVPPHVQLAAQAAQAAQVAQAAHAAQMHFAEQAKAAERVYSRGPELMMSANRAPPQSMQFHPGMPWPYR